jgi:hypothetical protein
MLCDDQAALRNREECMGVENSLEGDLSWIIGCSSVSYGTFQGCVGEGVCALTSFVEPLFQVTCVLSRRSEPAAEY